MPKKRLIQIKDYMVNLEYYLAKLIKKLHLRAIICSKVHRKSKVCVGFQLMNVTIDKYSDIGYDCVIINTSLGAFCSLGCNIRIGGASHSIHWVSTSTVFNRNKDHLPWKFANHKYDPWLKTYIGNDVWIADNVLIKAGLRIGDGL